MMRGGRSFSGRERHCFFLNTLGTDDQGRFANISAVSGIDWPDDGRGVALTDWDDDGDIDLWISNRNAPRLRLLRNDTPGENHYISLRLQGNGRTANRDAIGARVEIVLADEQTHRLIRTLRAGEGYLSQSTKHLHIGLGSADKIDRVVVRWPDASGLKGQTESFSGMHVDRRYLLTQGSGKAIDQPAIQPASPLPTTPVPTTNASETIRVPTVTRLRVPRFQYSPPLSTRPRSTGSGKPVLINLWASWCQPCLRELREFADRVDEIDKAGIDIVAFSVDKLDPDNGDAAAAETFLAHIDFPFASGTAVEQHIAVLQHLHDTLILHRQSLPLPSSFLVDGEGRLSVIYKGPVDVDQLIQDAQLTTGDLAKRHERAAPVPGRSIDHPRIHRMSKDFEATLLYRIAVHEMKSGNIEQAAASLLDALGYQPDYAAANDRLGAIYAMQQKPELAKKHLLAALDSNPKLASSRFHLAMILLREGNLEEALSELREAIHNDAETTFKTTSLPQLPNPSIDREWFSKLILVHTQLAWIMATHPDESIRNGKEAVRWAHRLVEHANRRNPRQLGILAAAYAEAGDFAQANATCDEAVKLVESLSLRAEAKESLLNTIHQLKKELVQGKPYRMKAQSPAESK